LDPLPKDRLHARAHGVEYDVKSSISILK
jgi:hypothetical protein